MYMCCIVRCKCLTHIADCMVSGHNGTAAFVALLTGLPYVARATGFLYQGMSWGSSIMCTYVNGLAYTSALGRSTLAFTHVPHLYRNINS